MLKFYDCKVCETPCIGMPFDGEIYNKEVCSPECLAQLEAAEPQLAPDGFPPSHRDEPFCECDVCMGFVSRKSAAGKA